jgi:ABC-2 type transport system permease protein
MNATLAQDLGAVIRKELKEYLASGGGRSRYLSLFILALFGIVIPLVTGSHGTDGWAASAIPFFMYAFLQPTVIILGLGPDAFAGERERHTLETLLASRLPDHAIYFGKLIAVTIYGWIQGLLSALLALLTINIVYGGALMFYPAHIAVGIVIVGLLMSLVAAAATSLVSLRASTVRQAQQVVSFGMIAFIFALTFILQALPQQVQQNLTNSNSLGLEIIVGLAALAALLILWAMALFRRARLILTAS